MSFQQDKYIRHKSHLTVGNYSFSFAPFDDFLSTHLTPLAGALGDYFLQRFMPNSLPNKIGVPTVVNHPEWWARGTNPDRPDNWYYFANNDPLWGHIYSETPIGYSWGDSIFEATSAFNSWGDYNVPNTTFEDHTWSETLFPDLPPNNPISFGSTTQGFYPWSNPHPIKRQRNVRAAKRRRRSSL